MVDGGRGHPPDRGEPHRAVAAGAGDVRGGSAPRPPGIGALHRCAGCDAVHRAGGGAGQPHRDSRAGAPGDDMAAGRRGRGDAAGRIGVRVIPDERAKIRPGGASDEMEVRLRAAKRQSRSGPARNYRFAKTVVLPAASKVSTS